MLWVGAALPALRALQGEAAGGISRGSGKLGKTTEAEKEGFRTTPYLLELVGAQGKADLKLQATLSLNGGTVATIPPINLASQ